MLKAKANNKGITDIASPNRNAESMSPKRIAQRATGQHTSLSKVFERVSQGMIEGPTDVAVKNVVMPINPGSNSSKGMLLPMV
jgi:hypothetical protein